jgi:hypothetical protein
MSQKAILKRFQSLSGLATYKSQENASEWLKMI